MTNVILVTHVLVAMVLTVVILLQRSEGGALGIGGGGDGGLMSGRGVAGALTRTTIVFGAVFFISSLTLTTLATRGSATSQDRIGESGIPEQQIPTDDSLGLDGLDDILDAEGDVSSGPATRPSQQQDTGLAEKDDRN